MNILGTCGSPSPAPTGHDSAPQAHDQPLPFNGETGSPVSPQKSILIYMSTEIYLIAQLHYTIRKY